jgi:hypothetical protein
LTDNHSTKSAFVPALALALTIGALASASPSLAQSAVSEGQNLAFDRSKATA